RGGQGHCPSVAGGGPWAERQVGKNGPRAGALAGRVLQEGRALEGTRMHKILGLAGEPAEGGVMAGRMVPLASPRPLPDGRQALGVLGFFRDSPSYFTPYERRLIPEFARPVSLSVQP